MGIPGQCDLYILGRGGQHWELEIKRYTKLSPEQNAWRAWCEEWGVPWKVLHVEKGEEPAATIARWLTELVPFLASPRF
jgi:hypothetical protein